MVPLATPLHRRSVLARDKESAGGSVRVTDWLVWQRLASWSVTVWDPALTDVYVNGDVTVANEPLSSLSWSVQVPPENVAVMVPVPPLHRGSTLASDSESAGGSASVPDCVPVRPLTSFRETTCDPGATPVQ